MEERKTIEKLEKIATLSGRDIESEVTEYPKSGINTFQKYRAWAVVPASEERNSFFVCFSDPYARVGQSTVYCGAFVALPDEIKGKLRIRKKDILDRLSMSSELKSNKLGNRIFDSRAVITGKMGRVERNLLSGSMLQRQILDSLTDFSGLHIFINKFHPDFVPELKGKSSLGIVYPQGWKLESSFVEGLLNRAEKIHACISEAG
ncbi:MAG: hypothetical protein ACQES0_09255 [Bacteroidota bacterium]